MTPETPETSEPIALISANPPSAPQTVATQNVPKPLLSSTGSVLGEEFFWTRARSTAARLVAEDEISDESIAAAVNVSRKTLSTWKSRPPFKAAVVKLKDEFREKVLSSGFCDVKNRLKVRTELVEGFLAIKRERGQRPEMKATRPVDPTDPSKGVIKAVPGGESGLVCLVPKMVGEEKFVEQIPDTALANEIRVGLKEIAQDAGQYVEKHEIGGPNGGAIVVQMSADDAAL